MDFFITGTPSVNPPTGDLMSVWLTFNSSYPMHLAHPQGLTAMDGVNGMVEKWREDPE